MESTFTFKVLIWLFIYFEMSKKTQKKPTKTKQIETKQNQPIVFLQVSIWPYMYLSDVFKNIYNVYFIFCPCVFFIFYFFCDNFIIYIYLIVTKLLAFLYFYSVWSRNMFDIVLSVRQTVTFYNTIIDDKSLLSRHRF